MGWSCILLTLLNFVLTNNIQHFERLQNSIIIEARWRSFTVDVISDNKRPWMSRPISKDRISVSFLTPWLRNKNPIEIYRQDELKLISAGPNEQRVLWWLYKAVWEVVCQCVLNLLSICYLTANGSVTIYHTCLVRTTLASLQGISRLHACECTTAPQLHFSVFPLLICFLFSS